MGWSEMKVGFTGTQTGISIAQTVVLRELLENHSGEFHHGDCIGADTSAHVLAAQTGLYEIHIHPPEIQNKRAWCKADKMYPAKPYLDRNKDIVRATELLIATPGEMEEQLRSGTWSTVRFARQQKRKLIIILPDGTVQ